MGDRKISQPSTAAVLTSVQDVQDHALTMASDKLLGKISEIEKSLAALSTQQIQLVDLKKSIWEELHLLRASRARAHKHGAVHPYPSLPMKEHASMTVNRGAQRSVFLVMTYNTESTGALYEVKFKYGGEVDDMGGGAALEPVVKFSRFKTGARIFNYSQLYVFTKDGCDKLCLRSFDTKSKTLLDPSINTSLEFKPSGTVVSAYDKLYFLEDASRFVTDPLPSFAKYNPDKKNWEQMPEFPLRYPFRWVTGYAVCYGIILYALFDGRQSSDVVAFHVGKQNWNKVEVDTHDYTPFRGRAVVVGETIYAMNLFGVNEIIAFSLKMNKCDNGSIAYSLIKLCKLDGLKIASPPCPFDELENDYLVHLGNHDFFHVTTGNNFEFYKVQHLCITTFQIFVREDGRHMIKTLHSTVFMVDIKACGPLMVTFGFNPECEDYEPIERESVASMEHPKQEDETTVDENSLMWEKPRRKERTCSMKSPEAA
ncbi:hypothetical protein ACE6H2_018175 [Prunus campanulata]